MDQTPTRTQARTLFQREAQEISEGKRLSIRGDLSGMGNHRGRALSRHVHFSRHLRPPSFLCRSSSRLDLVPALAGCAFDVGTVAQN